MRRREFAVENEYPYDRRGPMRWLWSHAKRYPHLPLGVLILSALSHALGTRAPIALGRTFDHVLGPDRDAHTLLLLSLSTLGLWLGAAALDVLCRVYSEFLSRRVEHNARDEFYSSLLGKSLGFHSRQQIGDLMARATGDVRMLNYTFSPCLRELVSYLIHLLFFFSAVALLRRDLLFVPLTFLIVLAWMLWRYARQIHSVAEAQRTQFGKVSAGLAEALSGIEVVKANAQEAQEEHKFAQHVGRWRELYVLWGEVQARYLPVLAYYAMLATGFACGLTLHSRDAVTLGEVIAFIGLLSQLEPLTVRSIVLLAVIARGMAGARRILELINTETELDENRSGVERTIQGKVCFEQVSFGYNGSPMLNEISFSAQPGETIAIVGSTGSGKTTLTRLINRVYDATAGRVLVDGVDVRDWSLAALRSQIATIEQDVYLFAQSIAENIAFGVGQYVSRQEIERCAREAQAHGFITRFDRGYDTVVGERGVTLSGGQRQRIAIARAFLNDSRILILDDATSAIDSATEDRIQAAMDKVQQGRTTFLITHRLSQIRWADRILVLQRGELVDQGTHDELLDRCPFYRRMFAYTIRG
jgi:ATP-binding cassette subfamily B protein